jgi:hypothetical protein
MEDWLQSVWNERLRVLLRKPGMLVLKLDVRPMIRTTNTDHMVIPGGMSTTTHSDAKLTGLFCPREYHPVQKVSDLRPGKKSCIPGGTQFLILFKVGPL